jgi:protein involved in polysaccharide export with SLBB domain
VGLNLDQATQRVRQRVRESFPDSDVEVSLGAVRSFRVYLAGQVAEPGARTATPVTRVSEIVPARGDSGTIYRNVVIRRGDDSIHVDLINFHRTGDTRDNPFLREGDVIFVPPVDATISVRGEVAYPGTYQFRAGETLADFLRVANAAAPFPSTAADTLFLLRSSEVATGEIRPIARIDAVGELGRSFQLRPFDAVYIPRSQFIQGSPAVQITGEVLRPGSYPVQRNGTTVRDLVEMAGGFRPQASRSEVVLRRATHENRPGSDQPLASIPPELLSQEERRILQVVSRADEGRIVLDLSDMNANFDIGLQPGDEIHVPERPQEVVVLGAVQRPGISVYSPGQTIDHFVAMAGGPTRRADMRAVTVLRSATGARLQRRDIDSIQPGDRIVVPFREKTSFLDRMQSTQGVVNTLSGVILTIIGLERLWSTLGS